MKQLIPLLSAVALLTLSACNNNEPEVLGSTVSSADEDNAANAAPVVLPPMVKLSRTYRCKDGSLIFVDFMSDDKTATIKTDKEGAATSLSAEEVGKAFKSDSGFSVEGSGDVITATVPGKGAQSCKD